MTVRSGKEALLFWSQAKSFTLGAIDCTYAISGIGYHLCSQPHPGFLFHDDETFGTRPVLARPAQFAAIRIDEDVSVIGEP